MVVLQGALNSILVFLPAMPPNTVSGNVTRAQITKIITIVPNGSAAVDWKEHTLRVQLHVRAQIPKGLGEC